MRRVLLLCLVVAGSVTAFFGLLAGVLWLRLSGPPAKVAADRGNTPAATTAPSTAPARATPPEESPAPAQPATPAAVRVGAIILKAEDAALSGGGLRLRDERGFRHIAGFGDDGRAQWELNVPAAGRYSVELTYAAPGEAGQRRERRDGRDGRDKGQGRAFTVVIGEQQLPFTAEPTGRRESFRMATVGTVRLPQGPTTLAIRASGGGGGDDPRQSRRRDKREPVAIRQVQVLPVDPLTVPEPAQVAAVPAPRAPERPALLNAAPPAPPPAQPAGRLGEVMRLALVDVQSGEVVGALFNGVTLDLGTLPPGGFTVRAELAGSAGSVRFDLDGDEDYRLENDPPYAIEGDRNGRHLPWRVRVGEHRLAVTSHAEPDGEGERGEPLRVKFRVEHVLRPGAPDGRIVLPAAAARLRGGEIRLSSAEDSEDDEGDDDPREEFIGWWSSRKDHAEWVVESPGESEYHVELTYACEDGAGGEFLLTAARTKLTGAVEPTGGWDDFKTRRVGVLRLPHGRQPLALRPGGRLDEALMNLKRIDLVPVTAADPVPPIVLAAADADLRGQDLRVEDGEGANPPPRHVAGWKREGDYVQWQAEVARPGRYRVELEYACDDGHGGAFVVSVGDRKVKGRVEPTGSFKAFRTAEVGTVDLRAGRHKARVKPEGKLNGRSLMDLRAVRLVPVP